MKPVLRIAIVAAESSADQLGAALIESLHQAYPSHRFVFEGIAGPKMRALGVRSLFPAEAISVMGLTEVLKSLPKILQIIRGLKRHLMAYPPDLFIGIDAPDFTLRIEKFLSKRHIPCLHYVSPSVWAWKKKRIFKLKATTVGVCCILPFEPDLYLDIGHPAWFVGHPLAEQVPLEKNQLQACERLGLACTPEQPILALLPGSRVQEVSRLLPVYLDAVTSLKRLIPGLQVIVPIAHEGLMPIFHSFENTLNALNVRCIDAKASWVLQAADAALATSGTVTLEAMLHKTPMVVSYRLSAITYALARRLIKIPYFSLPNIIAGERMVCELLQGDVTSERLVKEVLPFLSDTPARAAMRQRFRQLHERMRVNTSMRMPQIVMSALSRSVICPQTWVLGAGGQTGRSVVRYLISKHRPMMCLDDQPDAITQLGIDFPVLQGYCYSTSAWMERPHQWSQVREMIVSPGIAPAHPLIRWAVSQGIRVRGDIDVFFEEVDAPVIAVTGTNGKSTVTTLTGELLKAGGFNVVIGGNVGIPALDVLRDAQNSVNRKDSRSTQGSARAKGSVDVYVMELSSFQLYYTERPLKTRAATILNLEPDHLDWHRDVNEYYGAKWKLASDTEHLVLPDGLELPMGLMPLHLSRFTKDAVNSYELSKTLQAGHHRLNVAASLQLVQSFHLSEDCIREVLKAFPGLPFRCQWIRTHKGVDWYNDSKGTNVSATLAAIRSLQTPGQHRLIILLGGVGKGQDFSPLSTLLHEADTLKCCIVFGRDAPLIVKAFPGAVQRETLRQAIDYADGIAEPGDIVLFSPACASFDQFKHYIQRGEFFSEAVLAL